MQNSIKKTFGLRYDHGSSGEIAKSMDVALCVVAPGVEYPNFGRIWPECECYDGGSPVWTF